MSDFKTKTITYFENPGGANTEKAIELAVERIEEGDIKKIVVASSSGVTGLKAVAAFKGKGVQIIPVGLNAGSTFPGLEEWEKSKEKFESSGIKYVQGIQTFSGVERAVKERWNTAGPVVILSDALRIPCEGFKVGIEVAVMAADAGLICPDELVMTIAGTGRGADTVLVVKPAYSHTFFDFAVREIVCKPLVEGIKHAAK